MATGKRRSIRRRWCSARVAASGTRDAPPTNPAEKTGAPLATLAEKTTADPGAAFTPEVLERLAALRREDRAAFEALRVELKKSGCRVTALDQTIAEQSG